jgi:outer membrane protein OmpA-like peptidoglycan-associated protein
MASSIKEIEPIAENNGFLQADKSLVPLASFGDFNQNLIEGKLRPGDRFRLDGATYDPNIWQLTPRVSTRLNDLADYLKRFPSLEVELGFFTESLGDNQQNLKLSENRAATARDYLLKDGIPQNRISAVGYGETMPLNHCRDGVTCGMDEHFFNQRIEIKIVDVGERQ